MVTTLEPLPSFCASKAAILFSKPSPFSSEKGKLCGSAQTRKTSGSTSSAPAPRPGAWAWAPERAARGTAATTGGSSSSQPATPAYNGTFSGQDPALLRAAIENREPRSLFAGANGFVRGWDECSNTPFLRSEGARQVVAYDDPVSLEMKGQLVRQARMLGVNMFDVTGIRTSGIWRTR